MYFSVKVVSDLFWPRGVGLGAWVGEEGGSGGYFYVFLGEGRERSVWPRGVGLGVWVGEEMGMGEGVFRCEAIAVF
jgi:hypothetical protein